MLATVASQSAPTNRASTAAHVAAPATAPRTTAISSTNDRRCRWTSCADNAAASAASAPSIALLIAGSGCTGRSAARSPGQARSSTGRRRLTPPVVDDGWPARSYPVARPGRLLLARGRYPEPSPVAALRGSVADSLPAIGRPTPPQSRLCEPGPGTSDHYHRSKLLLGGNLATEWEMGQIVTAAWSAIRGFF